MLCSASMRAGFLAVALLLTPLALSAAPSDAERATARALAIEGQDALKAKDYKLAADRFERASSLIPAPTLKLGHARALAGLGKLLRSQELYIQVAGQKLAADAPEPFKRAVDDAQVELEALKKRIPWVTINVEPKGTRVVLDGADVPYALFGVRRAIDPGVHRLRATSQGYLSMEQDVIVREGKALELPIRLQAIRPEEPAVVAVPPPATAAGAAAAPPSTPPPTPKPTEPPPAKTEPPPEPAPVTEATPSGSTQKTLGIVATSLGGVGLLAGGVLGGVAIKLHKDLEAVCDGNECSSDDEHILNNYRTVATISTVCFIAGGVLAAGGIVLWATAPSGESSASVGVGPGFMSVKGSF